MSFYNTSCASHGCPEGKSTKCTIAVPQPLLQSSGEPDDCPLDVRRYFERMNGLSTQEGEERGLRFYPKADDVLLTTGTKSGTAWTQQIMHGLRSGGDMNFDDIDAIIPFLEYYCDQGDHAEMDFTQPFAPPRFFKTHVLYDVTPRGFGKYIFVTREPKDSIVSLYYFHRDWLFERNAISLDSFVEWMVIRDNVSYSSYANALQHQHLISWFPHRKDKNVLWLHYEDMKEDLAYCIRLIAEFLDIGTDSPKLLKLVEHQATFDFMKRHRSKFDAHRIKAARNEAMGLPLDSGIKGNFGRVRKGQINEGNRLLSEHMNQKMDAKWKSFVAPVVGYRSYAEMRRAVNKELGRTVGVDF